MQRPLACATLLLALLVPRGTEAVEKEWYDLYLDVTDHLMPAGRYDEALQELNSVIKMKPKSDLNARTYGVEFIDYVPYYYKGLAYFKKGDYESALRWINYEVGQQLIQRRSALWESLVHVRVQAQDQINSNDAAKVARRAREDVDRFIKEAEESEKSAKYDDALSKLDQAKAGAKNLPPETQALIAERIKRAQTSKKASEDARDQASRLDAALSEGNKALAESRFTDASTQFGRALSVDPESATAKEGQQKAREGIRFSTTRQERERSFQEGKALLQAGKYEEAIRPLTEAAADPSNPEARSALTKAQQSWERISREKKRLKDVARLLEDGQRLLALGDPSGAQVRFDGILQLDPRNMPAQTLRDKAEQETYRRLIQTWMPNRPPIVDVLMPELAESGGTEVFGNTLRLDGVATDDRGVARVEIRTGKGFSTVKTGTPRAGTGEPVESIQFWERIPLEPGDNEITVIATDTSGLQKSETIHIVRRLRFWETRAFLPSALGGAFSIIGLGFAIQHARRRRALRNRFNPYIAGAPVMDDEMFFGRDKLMARIMNVLHHNSLMITGERRIGKTTFLYHLKKSLEADEWTEYKFFPVFTDLQGVTEDDFFHALMADVAEALALPPSRLEVLRFRREQPQYDGRDFSHDLQRVIESLKGRTPKKVKLVLLIDEVDVLNDFSERINQRLRSIFMKTFSEHLVAIMSGVGIRRSWQSEGSPWYNFFDEVELGVLSRADAEALIRTPVEGSFRFEPEAVEAILSHSELRPYVIQKFCIHVIGRIHEEGRTTVTAFDVEAVREAVLFESQPAATRDSPVNQASA